MPYASVYFIKSAWIWFLIGIALGAYMGYERLAHGMPMYVHITGHVHVLTVGFITQWIMGIAYWIYPRDRKNPINARDKSWNFVLTVWCLLNLGTLVRVIGEFNLKPLYLAGIALQTLACILFVKLIWKRIRLPETLSKRAFSQSRKQESENIRRD